MIKDNVVLHKNEVWILIRIASARQFLWEPTTYVWMEKYGKLSLNFTKYPPYLFRCFGDSNVYSQHTILRNMEKLELSEDLTIAPLKHYLRRKINLYKLKIRETEITGWKSMSSWFQYTQYIVFILYVCNFVLFQLFMPRSSGEKCNENFRYSRSIHPLSTWV